METVTIEELEKTLEIRSDKITAQRVSNEIYEMAIEKNIKPQTIKVNKLSEDIYELRGKEWATGIEVVFTHCHIAYEELYW